MYSDFRYSNLTKVWKQKDEKCSFLQFTTQQSCTKKIRISLIYETVFSISDTINLFWIVWRIATHKKIYRICAFYYIYLYIMRTLFHQFFNFILFRPRKRCLIISHSQKIFQICFTISVDNSIKFINLVQAVFNWAVGRSKYVNRIIYTKSRAKLKYVPWLGDFLASF